MSSFESFDSFDDSFPQDDAPIDLGMKPSTGRGVCSVCGEPAYDGRAKKCEEHRTFRDDTKPKGKGGRPRKPNLEDQISNTLLPLAMIWSVRDPVCGQVAFQQVPEIARTLAAQAEASPRLKKALTAASSTGGWLAVGMAVAPIVAVAMQHHGPQSQPAINIPDGAGPVFTHPDEPVMVSSDEAA